MQVLLLARKQLEREGKLNKYSEKVETAMIMIRAIEICKWFDLQARNKKVALTRKAKC